MSNYFKPNGAAFLSDKTDWETPQALFDSLNEIHKFTLDPCATHDNAKCSKYYTIEDNGLIKSWANECVFVNPPYDRNMHKWIEKCYKEKETAKIVLLIPARTDTRYFHEYI